MNRYLEKWAIFSGQYTRHKYVEKDWTKLKSPVASFKYDGANFMVMVDEDGKLRLFSRRPSVRGGYPERTNQLPHLTSKLMPQYAGSAITAELIHTGFEKDKKESHPNVSGILNSLPPRAIQTQEEKGPVRAVLIDVKNPSLPTYGEKMEYLKKFEKEYGNPDLVFTPELKHGVPAINKYLEKAKEQNREGLIVTDYNEPEETNLRYKVKNYVTYNLRVVGFQQEIDIHGTPKESMGALLLEDSSGKMVGKVGTGFDRAMRIDAWEHPENWRGKLVQVKAYPPSVPGGQIRFPVYNGFADGDIDRVNL